ncbi:hypothetical protein BDM02DRAFT_1147304 [Thelephora ganbajun]|uniref:Uncharacterized protein n=1 Tax=Thelephora ganbajun TaxID=370292 RepID=A0ACB6ZWZ9_THEGA|nr:hypothetical protein BDM02DRAFT_1147304 [Thelephora ganbajun]
MNSATPTLFVLQSVHDARIYHPALVSYSLRARGLAVIGSIQTSDGGLFSACFQVLVEWERKLTSSAHISALGGRWNIQGVGSLFIHMTTLLFSFPLHGLLTYPDAVIFEGWFPVPLPLVPLYLLWMTLDPGVHPATLCTTTNPYASRSTPNATCNCIGFGLLPMPSRLSSWLCVDAKLEVQV